MNRNKITGSVIGLVLGDAYGAPYEGGVLERFSWKLIGKQNGRLRWTDDTQMTIDVIESLLSCGCVDQNDMANRFAQSYQWSRGYGPGAAKLVKQIRRGQSWETANKKVFRNGSFGNGGAMRAPAIGLFYAKKTESDLIQAAHDAAVITHAHPFGYEGAIIIALATAYSYNSMKPFQLIEKINPHIQSNEFLSRLQIANEWLTSSSPIKPKIVESNLGNDSSALRSCVTSIYAALSHITQPFDSLLNYVINIRGDVDTIAAMSCAIWGAYNGFPSLPTSKLHTIEDYEKLLQLAETFADFIEKQS